jgi:large subunit ribosomal protein L25
MEKVILEANKRNTGSKSSRNVLRRNGKVPGVFYSKHNETISIEVNEKSIKPLVFTTETHLIGLKVDSNQEFDCIIKDVQFDPVTDNIVHFDLIGLTSNETIQLEVPVLYIGSPVGVRDGGVLQQSLHKLEIECLPKDIPQHFEINISDLKLGDSIHVGDLSFENVKILNLKDTVVVAVGHPKVEKEVTEEAVQAEPAEPEVIGKGKAEEEEEPEKE